MAVETIVKSKKSAGTKAVKQKKKVSPDSQAVRINKYTSAFLRNSIFFLPYAIASNENPAAVDSNRKDLSLGETVWLKYLELKKIAPNIDKINKPDVSANSKTNYKAKFLLDDICNDMRRVIYGISKSYWFLGGERGDVMQEGFCGLYKGIRDAQVNRCDNNPHIFYGFLKLCSRRQTITGIKTANTQKYQHLNKARSLSSPAYADDDNCDRTLGDILSSGKKLPEQIVVEADELRTILEGTDLSELEANCFYLTRVLGHSYDAAAEELNIAGLMVSDRFKKKYDKSKFDFKSVDTAVQRADRKITQRLNELKEDNFCTKERTVFVEQASESDYLLFKEYCLGMKPIATKNGKILIREKEQLPYVLTAADENVFALRARCAARARGFGSIYSVTVLLSRLILDLDLRDYYGTRPTIEDFSSKEKPKESAHLSSEARMFSLRGNISYDLANKLLRSKKTKVYSQNAQTITGMSLDDFLVSYKDEELYTKTQTASFLDIPAKNVEAELQKYSLPFVKIQQNGSKYWRCPFSTISTYLILKSKTKKSVETKMN